MLNQGAEIFSSGAYALYAERLDTPLPAFISW